MTSDRQTPRSHAPRTPAEAVRRLVAGNQSFVRMAEAAARGESVVTRLDPSDVEFATRSGAAPKQRPFAAVLGCSDARVPVEIVFQQRSNDLFVVRVAGNGTGLGGLGSFRYAASQFQESLRLMVVLGHSHCGAVTAAVDAFLRPRNYLPLASHYPLRSIVDGLLVAVRAGEIALESVHGSGVAKRPGHREALVEVSVVVNSALSAFSLEQELPNRQVGVVYGRYDLRTGRLSLPLAGDDGPPLTAAPRDEAGFRLLGERLASSPEVTALLRGPRKAA